MEERNKLGVFLDSNVIISGLYSSKGAPGMIMKYFITGELMVVISQKVLEEVVFNINKKIPEILPVLRKILLNSPPKIVKNPTSKEINKWENVINRQDASILAAAVAANPDYLITGDKHFFENPDIAKKSRLDIITPVEFLKYFKKGNVIVKHNNML
jgi:putative PIN family toxin of toxin-antitoxin system